MITVYMDESGDLGFDRTKSGTSRFFLMTFLVVGDTRQVDRAVKKILATFDAKKRQRLGGVLHCYKLDDGQRKKIFHTVMNVDGQVFALIIDKKRLLTDIKNDQHILYATIANTLLSNVVHATGTHHVHFVASRLYTNKVLSVNFKTYIDQYMLATHAIQTTIDIATPQEQRGLQLVDAISRAVFRKYEQQDETYYDLIKEKIYGEYHFGG